MMNLNESNEHYVSPLSIQEIEALQVTRIVNDKVKEVINKQSDSSKVRCQLNKLFNL